MLDPRPAPNPIASDQPDRPRPLDARLLSLAPGGVIEIRDLPLRDFPSIPYEKIAGGPQFLFSDQPEYIAAPEGAVLRETVEPGIVRLYTYHCNGVEGTVSKITTVLENIGKRPLHYRFLRNGFGGPSGDYGAVAKLGLNGYFRSTPEKSTREIPIGGAVPLDPRAEAARVAFNELIHGFHEIEIDQPARVTVLQTAPSTDSVAAARRIGISDILIPKSPAGAGRGLYRTSNFRVTPTPTPEFRLDTAAGSRQLIVADGKTDPWIRGTDGATGKATVLEGNYGVLYDIRIPYSSSDGHGWAVLTWNARSRDQWCEHMVNVIGVNAGRHPAGFVEVPSDRVSLTGELDVSLLQIYPPPPAGQTATIELTYTPPGASCLPTPILFVPMAMRGGA